MSIATLLSAFLGNDNSTRRQAEAFLVQQKVDQPRQVVCDLVDVLRSGTESSHQLLSAILLRSITIREPDVMRALPPMDFAQVRTILLQLLSSDTNGFVKRKVADLAVAHAGLSEWPELFQAIIALNASPIEHWNQLGLYLIDKLGEHVGSYLRANLDTTLQIIGPRLQSGGLQTQCAAASALCSIAHEMSDYDERIGSLLAHVPPLVVAAIQSDDEAAAQELLGVLTRLCKARPSTLAPSAATACDMCVQVCSSSEPDEATRSLALDLCTSILTSPHSSRLISAGSQMRNAVTNICIQLLTQIPDSMGTIHLSTRPNLVSGFDGDDEEGESTLAEQAVSSLEEVAMQFEPSETLVTCLGAASQIIGHADWRHRRAALLVVAVICGGTSIAMKPHLGQLVTGAVALLSDPHPRVRYAALQCLLTLTTQYSDDDDGDNDDDSHSSNFQAKFYQQVPAAVCAAIEANAQYPQLVYAGLSTLKTFFNPDACEEEHAAAFAPALLDFCLAVLTSADALAFVREEAASLVGNVSLLTPKGALGPRYQALKSALIAIIFAPTPSLPSPAGDGVGGGGAGAAGLVHAAHEHSQLRGRCLESFALLGRAAGPELFTPDAHTMLQHVCGACGPGVDFSDPFTSYMLQAGARMAGTMGDAFAPYVPSLLPTLLGRIAEPFTVQILDEEIPGGGESGSGGDDSGEVVSVYKRGLGMVRVVMNTHEIGDKEFACRALYQYFMDCPQLLLPYAAATIQAVAPIMESMHFSEDLVMVAASIITETIKVHIKFSDHSAAAAAGGGVGVPGAVGAVGSAAGLANEMIERGLRHLMAGMERTQASTGHQSAPSAVMQFMVDGARELLKIAWGAGALLGLEGVRVSPELMGPLLVTLRDEVVVAINRRFVAVSAVIEGSSAREEADSEIEDGIWDGLIDAIGWLVKLFGDSISGTIVSELLPLLEGVLSSLASSGGDPSVPLVSLCTCLLIDVVENVPSLALHCADRLAPVLLECIQIPECRLACAFGIGVCASKGLEGFDAHCARATAVLLTTMAGLTTSSSSAAGGGGDDDRGDDVAAVKENIASSLFKLCVFRREAVSTVVEVGKIMPMALSMMPFVADSFEGREVNELVVDLLRAQDQRLTEAGQEACAQAFRVLVKICALGDEADDDPELHLPSLDHWEEKGFYRRTIGDARALLRSWLACSSYASSPPEQGTIAKAIIDALLAAQPPEVQRDLAAFVARHK